MSHVRGGGVGTCVFSDGHQMSLAGGGYLSNSSWVMVTWRPLCEQTDACGNITFMQFHLQVVKNGTNIVCLH